MTLVRQKENAEIIREELRAIDGRYGPYRGKPRIPHLPCPFSAALLGMSWDVDLDPKPELSYLSGVSVSHNVLPASIHCWGGGTYCVGS